REGKAMGQIKAILFDKYGTLFDFQKTWGAFQGDFLRGLSAGDDARLRALADATEYDLETGLFLPGSPVIAGSLNVVTALMIPHLPGWTEESLVAEIREKTALARQVPVCPLAELFDHLRNAGLPLGIATNDAEAPAREHLRQEGIEDRFTFIAGYDSGYGGKPEPGQLLAFAQHVGRHNIQRACNHGRAWQKKPSVQIVLRGVGQSVQPRVISRA
ncbi:MAG: HAD family hydrolase, partial [Pseudomonadota bacterium]